jgi:putative hydrolase
MLDLAGLELASIGAGVEVSERWRCPSPRAARRLHGAGVELVPGTDAHAARDVGRYSYVRDVLRQVPGWSPGRIIDALVAA